MIDTWLGAWSLQGLTGLAIHTWQVVATKSDIHGVQRMKDEG